MRVAIPDTDAAIPSLSPHYSAEIIGAAETFAQTVYRNSILPLRLFEGARVATAVINGCSVCMAWRTARDGKMMGLEQGALAGPEPDEEFYQALLSGDDGKLTDKERVAVQYARAMGENPRGLAADEALWSELREHLSEAEIVDLSYCVAAWMGLGRVAHVLGIDAACTLPN